MRENIDVFDFELTEDDMDVITALDSGESLFFSLMIQHPSNI